MWPVCSMDCWKEMLEKVSPGLAITLLTSHCRFADEIFRFQKVLNQVHFQRFQSESITKTSVNMCVFQIILMATFIAVSHGQTCGFRVQKSDLCVEYGEVTWRNSNNRCVSFTGQRLLLSCAGLEGEKVITIAEKKVKKYTTIRYNDVFPDRGLHTRSCRMRRLCSS